MTEELTPNLFEMISPIVESIENVAGDGDCGIIVKSDGSFRAFAVGLDPERLADPANCTDKGCRWDGKGEILMALFLALSNEHVMKILLDLSRSMVDPEALRRAAAK